MAQFYRANFAGREGNYFLWAALHQLLFVYDTVRIVGTQGKCLRPEKLVRRESFPYEELFSASASFFESVVAPLQREIQSEFSLLGRVYNEAFSSDAAERSQSIV